MREIGSEFCLAEEAECDNEFFRGYNVQHMRSGRDALYYVLKEIQKNCLKKTAYLPAYICSSILEPFLKLGFKIIYYDIDFELRPVFDDKVLDEIDILFFGGYFGYVYYNQRFLNKCKRKKIYLLQDATHTLFSKNGIYNDADYVIASLRKWFGVLCGGMAISIGSNFLTMPLMNDGMYIELRNKGFYWKKRFIQEGIRRFKNLSRDYFNKAETILENELSYQQSDDLSIAMITKYNISAMKEKRKCNFLYLLENIKNCKVRNVFNDLAEGVCPLFFPVYIFDQKNSQKKLIEQEIYSPIHWPYDKRISIQYNWDVTKIYSQILSLPCDQRYSTDDMRRICYAVNQF